MIIIFIQTNCQCLGKFVLRDLFNIYSLAQAFSLSTIYILFIYLLVWPFLDNVHVTVSSRQIQTILELNISYVELF